MANTFRTLLGLRAGSAGQDMDTPRTTKQVQEMVDWQNLQNHLDQYDKANKKIPDPAASSNNGEVTQPDWGSLSTQRLEKELLARKFHAAHSELGRRASELQDIILQHAEAEDGECNKALQIYTQLMKDSTELLAALANKMCRLRSKIDLSTSLAHTRRPQSRGSPSPMTQPIDSIGGSDSTQHRSWVQPKAPEHAPSHRASYRRAASQRQNPRNFMSGPAKLQANRPSAEPVPGGNSGNTKCVHEPLSQQLVKDQEVHNAEKPSESYCKTLMDLPILKPDELHRLEQPSTLPDLPIIPLYEQ